MITDYASLQTTIASFLNRGDLTVTIETLIQLAELSLRSDERVEMTEARTINVASDDFALPGDFRSIKNLYHDGPDFYGPISIVRPDEIGRRKGTLGETGTPRYAAVIDTPAPVLRFAPIPDATTPLKLVYEAEIESLSDSNTTNTLLTERPDVYLYASLMVAAPFLHEDQRIQTWNSLLEKALDMMAKSKKNREFGGRITMRPRKSIGSDV